MAHSGTSANTFGRRFRRRQACAPVFTHGCDQHLSLSRMGVVRTRSLLLWFRCVGKCPCWNNFQSTRRNCAVNACCSLYSLNCPMHPNISMITMRRCVFVHCPCIRTSGAASAARHHNIWLPQRPCVLVPAQFAALPPPPMMPSYKPANQSGPQPVVVARVEPRLVGAGEVTHHDVLQPPHVCIVHSHHTAPGWSPCQVTGRAQEHTSQGENPP